MDNNSVNNNVTPTAAPNTTPVTQELPVVADPTAVTNASESPAPAAPSVAPEGPVQIE